MKIRFEDMQLLAGCDKGWICLGMEAGMCIAWQDTVHKVSTEIPRADARDQETTEVSHEYAG